MRACVVVCDVLDVVVNIGSVLRAFSFCFRFAFLFGEKVISTVFVF